MLQPKELYPMPDMVTHKAKSFEQLFDLKK